MSPHMTPPTPSIHHDRATVLAWLDGDIDGRALLLNIQALHKDTDWRVQSALERTFWDIRLVYWPTGETDTIRLEPVAGTDDAVWRRVG